LTFKMAEKILANLPEINTDEKFKLLESLSLASNKKTATEAMVLSNDQYAMIADWWNYAILAVLEIPQGPKTIEELSKRLGVDKYLIKNSLERMRRLGILLNFGPIWKFAGEPLKTTEDIPNKAIRRSHVQHMNLAIKAIETQGVHERDISGTTFSCSKKNLPKAKEAIRKFRSELCKLMEGDELEGRDQVYRLNIQLFKLDKN